MKQFCIDLKLDIPLFKNQTGFVFPQARHTKYDLSIINQKMIDFFDQRNLVISLVEIFYSPPFFKSNIHIDGKFGDYVKVNFIFGGTNGIMSWFTAGKTNNAVQTNDIGKMYSIYNRNDVKLLFRKTIDISIVQVGMPHMVENFEKDRWAICLIPRDKKTYQKLTMKQSKRIFEDVLKVDNE